MHDLKSYGRAIPKSQRLVDAEHRMALAHGALR
jgi:hypothetical protein